MEHQQSPSHTKLSHVYALIWGYKQHSAPYSVMKTYTLLNASGKPYKSHIPGTLGGYRPLKIYGRLACPSAARWLAKGFYAKQRVFFPDESTAIRAGYRPCARCLPEKYKEWKKSKINRKRPDAKGMTSATKVEI
ncbi:hypothetical protein GGR57DRAFT_501116 [Xylariaceae sp. FL1272]|nr:hypothetical protein GGR57DRAFT_501116 [Xylariaceae sp. FL1272]